MHTPGPWTVVDGGPGRTPICVEGGSWTVARIEWREHDDDPAEMTDANARLIAAAPDMLAALRLYFSHPERFNKAASDVLARIDGA